ncbi:MAG: sulfatase [Bryobacterales bacterium]|nr:sulfatase [Bryobacterales bacterium]
MRRRELLATPLAAAAAVQGQPASPPNIVFLISDDHSAPDLGCMGNSAIRTPHLDRMAADGMRFTRCFVASPQCSPNRSAILTGCAPHTTSTSRLHTPMPDWEPSVLEPLKQRGYFAGAFRKVHQGAAFDKRWDFYGDARAPFSAFFDKRPKDRPFFLHVGFTDPHRPYAPGAVTPPHDPAHMHVPAFLPDTPDVRKDLAFYHDEISRMDSECGQVLALLRQHGLEENTLVIFTGDNGMPFPRAKGTCYDPGIHVPLLARWPGRIAAGVVRQQLISHVDLAPTWLTAAGLPVPGKMQGRSFLNLLTNAGSYAERDTVFSERNWHDNFDPIRSVRTATHKLIFNAAPHFPYRPALDLENSLSWASILEEGRRGRLKPELKQMLHPTRPLLELYDLTADPNEFQNLATSIPHSEILSDMTSRLSTWMEETLDFLPPGRIRRGQPGTRDWPLNL